MKKILISSSVILLVLLGTISYFYYDFYKYATTPIDLKGEPCFVNIVPGQNFGQIVKQLKKNKLVKHPDRFRRVAVYYNYDNRLRAGEYTLSTKMSPKKILETLAIGKVKLYRLTVPEGYNLYQIAELIESSGFGTKQNFIKVATDPVFSRKLSIDGKTFEGYLFPDTYYFPKKVSMEKIITTMVKQFRSIYLPEWEKRSKELKLSTHEIITLASIIEKETGAGFERPLISSVFHNRLKKRMRLETDPTVIYGIKNFDGNLTRVHLVTRTPYNTYRIRGLPPGPIANPGIYAIEAALYPKKTNFLFFVSKKDTTHKFSTNINDHNKAVRKYQLRRRRRNRS